MANCTSCGGSIADPFDLSTISESTCQCNSNGLVTQTESDEHTCCVVSVNGLRGAVALTIDDIDLLGNQFYSDELVWASLTGDSPITFNALTGHIGHANSGVSAGAYGSSSQVPVITVNNKGHITSISLASIPSTATLSTNLSNLDSLSGTGFLVKTATDTWVFRTLTSASGRILITYPDGVSSNPLIDLETTGVVAGTYGTAYSYPLVTVDIYGRITSITNQTVPTPTVAPHSHALGDLTDVDDGATTAPPSAYDVLYYDGGQWTYGAFGLLFFDVSLTPSGAWKIARAYDSSSTLDSINYGKLIRDINGVTEVFLNAVLYIDFATVSAGAAALGATSIRYVMDYTVGTVGQPPKYNTVIELAHAFTCTKYYNESGAITAFVGNMLVHGLTISIDQNGNVKVSFMYENGPLGIPTLGGTTHLILPITCSYLVQAG